MPDDDVQIDTDTSGGDGGSSWKPPASQADLDRIVQQRLDRERAKLTSRFADYDAVKAKAEQFDALAAASKTDQERAAEEAAEAAYRSAMSRAVPRIVSAEFKAEAARQGVDAEQLNALLEDLDLVKYATDDGDPDVEKISSKLAKFAPVKPQRATGPSPSGLGNRGGNVNVTAKEAAASYISKRFPNRAKAS